MISPKNCGGEGIVDSNHAMCRVKGQQTTEEDLGHGCDEMAVSDPDVLAGDRDRLPEVQYSTTHMRNGTNRARSGSTHEFRAGVFDHKIRRPSTNSTGI